MLWGYSDKTITLFDYFEKNKNDKYMLLGYEIEVNIKRETCYLYLIVTKRNAGYDSIAMQNSNVTISDIKKLSSSQTINIKLDDIKKIVNKPISFSPNISLPIYRLLLIIADIVKKNGIEVKRQKEFPYVNEIISKNKSENVIDIQIPSGYEGYYANSILLPFIDPILLRAQNSNNRTGYGWIWEWNTVTYEGTYYGETTGYPIVGCYITKQCLYHNEDFFADIERELISFREQYLDNK